jgi:hypothetical protein
LIYTRNKEVWKATNRDILEKHLVDEGIDFNKDSVDAVHARYVAELQAADEAKVKAEEAKAKAKAAETAASTPPTTPLTTEHPAEHPVKPLDEEAQRMLALLPRLTEVITDMWNASAIGQGWQLVAKATENKYGARLAKLSGEVYIAYQSSKGSEEGLQALLKQRAPRPAVPQNPQSTPSTTPPTTIITPQDQKSSTNQTQLPKCPQWGGHRCGQRGG